MALAPIEEVDGYQLGDTTVTQGYFDSTDKSHSRSGSIAC